MFTLNWKIDTNLTAAHVMNLNNETPEVPPSCESFSSCDNEQTSFDSASENDANFNLFLFIYIALVLFTGMACILLREYVLDFW